MRIHPNTIEATTELIHDLSAVIKHTAFDYVSRIAYSTDASIYQMMPVGVVFPQNAGEVAAAVEIAGRHGVPVLPRGGGSSIPSRSSATLLCRPRGLRRARRRGKCPKPEI